MNAFGHGSGHASGARRSSEVPPQEGEAHARKLSDAGGADRRKSLLSAGGPADGSAVISDDSEGEKEKGDTSAGSKKGRAPSINRKLSLMQEEEMQEVLMTPQKEKEDTLAGGSMRRRNWEVTRAMRMLRPAFH